MEKKWSALCSTLEITSLLKSITFTRIWLEQQMLSCMGWGYRIFIFRVLIEFRTVYAVLWVGADISHYTVTFPTVVYCNFIAISMGDLQLPLYSFVPSGQSFTPYYIHSHEPHTLLPYYICKEKLYRRELFPKTATLGNKLLRRCFN